MTTFRLALRNITSKPWRAVATVLVIAIAVALLFCVFSFKEAVYQYIYDVETSDSGNSDIIIKTNSSSDRITSVSGLDEVDGIESVVPSLNLYALFDGEYVKLRGFEKKDVGTLQTIVATDGDASALAGKSDNVVVSSRTAEHFGLSVGSRVTLTLGSRQAVFFVCAISNDSGYFTSDSPYTFVGICTDGVARLISQAGYAVYNEIYVKAEQGKDVQELIDDVSSLPAYSAMTVEPTADEEYLQSQSNSLSAPVIISGIGVMLFAVACVVIVMIMSVSDKRNYVAKLTVAGATKKQIAAIFSVEALALAFIGAVVGSAAAGGVFLLLLKLTLSSTATFTVSVWKLLLSAAIGVVVSLVAALVPSAAAFKSTVRENELSSNKKSALTRAAAVILLTVTTASVAVELALDGAKGALSIVNIILVLASVAVCVPYVFRALGRLLTKSRSPEIKLAAVNVSREKRPSRQLQTLTVGMTVSMLLFMAWSLTTTIFTGYLSDFKDMVLVTNVQSGIDDGSAGGIADVDGVVSATPLVWRKGTVSIEGTDKTVNILGSEDALNIMDFKYVTDKDTIKNRLATENCVVLDEAYTKLYGVTEGDTVTVEVDGVSAELIVAGITSHKFFSGNYAVISKATLSSVYGAKVDTVLVIADDPSTVSERIRAQFAGKNYYTVEALTAYEWDAQSLSAIFDLVGVLAASLAALVFLVLLSSSVVSHSYSSRSRATLLSAGMSKNALLRSELFEYLLTSLTAFIISFAASALLTASLIGALRLFGLYYEYTYRAWVVAAVGGALAAGYAVLPLILGYKRSYNMKR